MIDYLQLALFDIRSQRFESQRQHVLPLSITCLEEPQHAGKRPQRDCEANSKRLNELEEEAVRSTPLAEMPKEFEEHACDLATERNLGDAVVLLIIMAYIKDYYLRVLIPRLNDGNDIADAN
ncbi:hypothetical protein P3342_004530 [Pyrenophora teres f. teres]|nr:hypothetical protein P3342_004530 [Pyrenophora teres f. teres]